MTANPSAKKFRFYWVLICSLLLTTVLAFVIWNRVTSRPAFLIQQGRAALLAKNSKAVREYASQIEAAGEPDEANLLRGEADLAFGAPDLALTQLNKINAKGPLRLKAAALSGRCLLEMGELKEAHRVLSAVVSEQPDHVDAFRGLAVIAYDLGQLSKAVEFLTRVAELDPQDARPYRLIGLIYKDMAQDAKSEEAYHEAIRRGLPSSMVRDVHIELAELLIRETKFAEGLKVATDLELTGNEDDQTILAFRAECLRGLGRQQEAARLLDDALSKHQHAKLFRLRGLIHQDLVQLPEALKCFENAVRLEPTEHQNHYALGQAYSGLGRAQEAAKAFARVAELKKNLDRITELTNQAMDRPWDPQVRLQLAQICVEMGKPELAQMWQKAAAVCGRLNR